MVTLQLTYIVFLHLFLNLNSEDMAMEPPADIVPDEGGIDLLCILSNRHAELCFLRSMSIITAWGMSVVF